MRDKLCWKKIDFFFFSSRRRHTRSLRDWSSDVCSSDLSHFKCACVPDEFNCACKCWRRGSWYYLHFAANDCRSEERRVGKECRSWWSPDHYKKKEVVVMYRRWAEKKVDTQEG